MHPHTDAIASQSVGPKFSDNQNQVFSGKNIFLFACWFQPAQTSQPTVFSLKKTSTSQLKLAPAPTSEQALYMHSPWKMQLSIDLKA